MIMRVMMMAAIAQCTTTRFPASCPLPPLRPCKNNNRQCSVGVCVDRSVDDVGFLEKVIADLPNRLAVNKGQVRESASVPQHRVTDPNTKWCV